MPTTHHKHYLPIADTPTKPDERNRSLTVADFCWLEQISRTKLYQAWREGWGPEFYYVASDRRISPEAHRKWRKARKRG